MDSLAVTGVPINVQHLDAVTQYFNQGTQVPPQIEQLLSNFINRPDLCQYSSQVLFSNCSPTSKFFFLKGLTETVSTNWLSIPIQYQSQIKDVLMRFIGQPYNPAQQFLMTKCFDCLSMILIYEMNGVWTTFFDDYFQMASQSPINSLNFLAFFTDLVINENNDIITSERSSEMTWDITRHLDQILSFVHNLLQNSADNSLIKAALPILSIFVVWLPPEAVFNSPIFHLVVNNYIHDQALMIDACDVLIEFLRHLSPFPDFVNPVSQLFSLIVRTLSNYSENNILEVPIKLKNSFIAVLEKCFSVFTIIFSQDELQPPLTNASNFLMQMTMNPDDESQLESILNAWMVIFNKVMIGQICESSVNVLKSLLSPLRRILIIIFPKPYCFCNYIDEFGNESKQFQIKSSFDNLYIITRDILIFLTNENRDDMIAAIKERMEQIPQLPVEEILRICYTIAATIGVFPEEYENSFILPIIEQFFQIALNFGSEGKMKMAGGLIYMCSQYYTILSRSFPLLKSIFGLILKFLNEGDYELEAISIFSLKSLGQRTCKNMIINVQEGEENSFLMAVLLQLRNLFPKLAPDNTIEFFKVIAILIRFLNDEPRRVSHLSLLMEGLNVIWNQATNPFDPFNINQCKTIYMVMQCHSSILLSLSVTYAQFLKEMMPSLMNIFHSISSVMINAPNEESLNAMKSAKSSIIFNLYRFSYFCYKPEYILDFIIPNSFELFLNDYNLAPPHLRLKASLKYFVAIYNRCSSSIDKNVFDSFDQIFRSTLGIINDPHDYNQELRSDFFTLMGTIIHAYPQSLSVKPPEYIDLFLNTLKFGAKLIIPTISEICIELISDLFTSLNANMERDSYIAFFDTYSVSVIEFLFSLLTDLSYKFAFSSITMAIISIFQIEYIRSKAQQILEVLCKMYPQLQPAEVMETVQKLIEWQQFQSIKSFLRNFILKVKIVKPNDPDLYKEELEEMKEMIKKPFKSLPGIELEQPIEDVPPTELVDNIASLSIRKIKS
ncbi:hypothetical protein TRFO_37537 [Tritrichomonas foetus]|uniref:Importin N-terminal domain-containing protein n=1 Tax=Tritrichomonas foetus TaxID=1144522 RepID=A0A1J4JAT8_9EUKA|nr:hypothetical protein TRFO_37537 [Tritrichomonas foetus]|eukprot:OHS96294.1 hypothetical protein TRFO_37537 [Tritrichomonas foetus]